MISTLYRLIPTFILYLALTVMITGCPEDNNNGTDPDAGTPVGTLTIQAVDASLLQPRSGVPISVNTADGAIQQSGVTGTDGRFVVTDFEEGGSLSFADVELKVIQTLYHLNTDKTYTIKVQVADPVVATLTPTYASLPAGAVYHETNVGGCRGDATVQIKQSCVQTDGKISIYATVRNNLQETIGYTVVTDVVIPASNLVNVTLNNWNLGFDRPNTSFLNSPEKFIDGSGTIVLKRKGVSLYFYPTEFGMTSDTGIERIKFQTPHGYAFSDQGEGYGYGFSGTVQRESGSTYGLGVIGHSQYFAEQLIVDLSKVIPSEKVLSLTVEFDQRPSFTWESTVGTRAVADAAILLTAWYNQTDDFVTWLGIADPSAGFVEMPELPETEFGDFLQADGSGVFTGQGMYFLDASWRADFADLMEHENIRIFFDEGWEPNTSGTMSYQLILATHVTMNKMRQAWTKAPILQKTLLRRL